MTKFKFDSQEDKESLIECAKLLKPYGVDTVATADGWSVQQNNGTFETLVSFKGLDELLAVEETISPELSDLISFEGDITPSEEKVS